MHNEAMELKSKVFNGKAQVEIYSNKGKIVASTISADSIGKSIIELNYANAEEIIKKIQKGESETTKIGNNFDWYFFSAGIALSISPEFSLPTAAVVLI